MKHELRRALERVEVPGEHDARERAWPLVRSAWAEREPQPRRFPLRALVALAAVLALVGAALSPPGRAVIDEVRDAIGVENAAPALFSLPAEGRLLVVSGRGVWIVHENGSKRLLGRYREASWSPNGLFVVAARANELVALDPEGELRWSLPRRAVRLPRWGGTRTDTRIAYLSGSTLRVVAGDSSGDRALADGVAAVAPAWRPGGGPHVLAFVSRTGEVNVYDVDRKERYWRSAPVADPVALAWSPDGSRLTAVSRDRVSVFRWNSRVPVSSRRVPGVVRAALAPDGSMALVVRRGGRSEVRVSGRVIFAGPGRFTDLAWSPDGAWLLAAWPDADQFVFLSRAGAVEAASRISTQFRAEVFPAVEGWCCPSNTVLQSAGARPSETAPAPAAASNTVLQGTKVVWRRSTSTGLPWAGRLERSVRLPAEGARFFTWDPIRKRSPNRAWRRHGNDRLVRMVLRVLGGFAAAHPGAPRIGVGDLSRPQGGNFGPRYGRPGHVSHQNGMDVDVYYPRRDRKETAPLRPAQIDRALAQELVDRFVAAGAVKVFVGPSTGLTGPPEIVQRLAHHDNHLHVRLAPAR